jgi:glutathione S-transferase
MVSEASSADDIDGPSRYRCNPGALAGLDKETKMRLIGMLDSPYVRRAAIALRLLDIPFEHDPLSVFRTFEQFSRINPVVKAPTLVCDDGTVLMDSGLIIDYAQTLAGRSLWPAELAARTRALRAAGLALAACEKAVQIVYELNVRPADKVHAPWLDRVDRQMRAAFQALDAEIARHPLAADEPGLTQAGLDAAIAWRFMQIKQETPIADVDCPALAAFSARVEALPVFAQTPPDETVNVSTPGYKAP